MEIKIFVLGSLQCEIKEYQSEREAADVCDDWCLVCGRTLEEAIKTYDFALFCWEVINECAKPEDWDYNES